MKKLTAALALLCVFALALGSGHAQTKKAPKAPPVRHVIIISVDSLMPAVYLNPDAQGLKVPNLRELARNGAAADPGARGVFPTSTYPSHTTMITGANPATHGVVANRPDDPTNILGDAMRFYTEDIKVPTLYQLAEAKGMKTALIYWPVTMGAKVDAIVPEFWRSQGGSEEDQKLQRAISTPGLIEAVAKRFPDFYKGFRPPRVEDVPPTHVAVHLIETLKPHLLLLHIFDVDHLTHNNGIGSPESKRAIEVADAQIGRVIEAAKRAGTWKDTVLVIVSDHGMSPYQRTVRLGVWLKDEGLITLDRNNRISDYKAWVSTSGGGAMIYLKDENDEDTKQRLLRLFRGKMAAPDARVSRIYSRDEIISFGGDPRAFIALEAASDVGFSTAFTGDAETALTSNRAHHGVHPDHPSMQASLIFYGPSIAPGKLEGARLIDLAPTVAPWLGLRMEKAEGRALNVPRKSR